MNQPLNRIESKFVVLPAENIDTDQICPARFLTTTSRGTFANALFADWRFDSDGQPRPDFPLNRASAHGARILVAGRNFGCGSSREHAVWALRDHGFEAVISTSFADIFRRNALKNGVVPVVVDEASHERLIAHPECVVVVDVALSQVRWPDGQSAFPIEPFARHCLLAGVDELGFLLAQSDAISLHEASHLND